MSDDSYSVGSVAGPTATTSSNALVTAASYDSDNNNVASPPVTTTSSSNAGGNGFIIVTDLSEEKSVTELNIKKKHLQKSPTIYSDDSDNQPRPLKTGSSLDIPFKDDEDSRSQQSYRTLSSSRRQSTEDSIDTDDEYFCYEMRHLEELERKSHLESLYEYDNETDLQPNEEIKEKMSFVLSELKLKVALYPSLEETKNAKVDRQQLIQDSNFNTINHHHQPAAPSHHDNGNYILEDSRSHQSFNIYEKFSMAADVQLSSSAAVDTTNYKLNYKYEDIDDDLQTTDVRHEKRKKKKRRKRSVSTSSATSTSSNEGKEVMPGSKTIASEKLHIEKEHSGGSSSVTSGPDSPVMSDEEDNLETQTKQDHFLDKSIIDFKDRDKKDETLKSPESVSAITSPKDKSPIVSTPPAEASDGPKTSEQAPATPSKSGILKRMSTEATSQDSTTNGTGLASSKWKLLKTLKEKKIEEKNIQEKVKEDEIKEKEKVSRK
jgi:protein unc-13